MTERENVLQYLISGYEETAYTNNYILGFAHADMIYMAFVDGCMLPYITKLDKASRGAGYSLRFKPDKHQKALLLTYAKPLCSKKFFEEQVEASIYNAGEIFEKIITENNGQTWVKDDIPYTKAGDIVGVSYQIKYDKATFTNEKTLASLRNKA